MRKNKLFYIISGYLLFFSWISAKDAYSINKVISKKFNWQVCQTEHFDVYFYDEAKNILPYFTEILEETYRDDTNNLDFEPQEKTPIFLYIAHNDFEQSNVVSIGEGTGGVTEAFKNRLVISHTGSKYWLDYVLHHEFTHVLQFNVLFNGFWKSARLIKSVFYPNWLLEGMAEYNTKDTASAERDMYLRDATISGNLIPLKHLHSFNHLKPHQVTLAYKESNELMKFIEEEYGKDKIMKMLNLYKDRFDSYSVLNETIGLNLDVLERKYFEYLEDRYSMSGLSLKEPETYGVKITSSEVYWEFNTNPVILSNNNEVIYITDRNGYEEIVLKNLMTEEVRTLVGIKDSDKVENISRTGIGVSVSGDDRFMVFVGEKEQKDYIYLYDLLKNKLKRMKTGFDIISCADISCDGTEIVFIAMQAGYNNIYSCGITGKNVRKIYGTFDDVQDAALSRDGGFIVFSKETKVQSDTSPYQKDLYRLNLKNESLEQLTSFDGDEYSPCISAEGETVVFVSDKDGVNNLYGLDIKTKNTKKLTDIIGGNFTPRFSRDGKKIAFSSYRKGQKHIYLSDVGNLENRSFFYSKTLEEAPFTMIKKPLLYSPYKFSPSTDLIYPLFYFSSDSGLFLMLYWQISDMTGDNSLNVATQYMGGAELLDYQFQYTFSKFRPQFFIQFQGQGNYYEYLNQNYDPVETIRENVNEQVVGVNYPLNRFNVISFSVKNSNIVHREDFYSNGLITNTRITGSHDQSVSIGFQRDTTTGKYIETTEGTRATLIQKYGTDIFGGEYVYHDSLLEVDKYFPLGLEYSIGNRLLFIDSTGRDYHVFSLFGLDRVRMGSGGTGYEVSGQYQGNRSLFIYNFEWRFPIVYDLNYYTGFMFPDFFFKSFYGTYFIDVGKSWGDGGFDKSDYVYSFGIGTRFDTFILQQFYLPLNFYMSFSPVNYKYEHYFTMGIVF